VKELARIGRTVLDQLDRYEKAVRMAKSVAGVTGAPRVIVPAADAVKALVEAERPRLEPAGGSPL
jgi:hypothetical protein